MNTPKTKILINHNNSKVAKRTVELGNSQARSKANDKRMDTDIPAVKSSRPPPVASNTSRMNTPTKNDSGLEANTDYKGLMFMISERDLKAKVLDAISNMDVKIDYFVNQIKGKQSNHKKAQNNVFCLTSCHDTLSKLIGLKRKFEKLNYKPCTHAPEWVTKQMNQSNKETDNDNSNSWTRGCKLLKGSPEQTKNQTPDSKLVSEEEDVSGWNTTTPKQNKNKGTIQHGSVNHHGKKKPQYNNNYGKKQSANINNNGGHNNINKEQGRSYTKTNTNNRFAGLMDE